MKIVNRQVDKDIYMVEMSVNEWIDIYIDKVKAEAYDRVHESPPAPPCSICNNQELDTFFFYIENAEKALRNAARAIHEIRERATKLTEEARKCQTN